MDRVISSLDLLNVWILLIFYSENEGWDTQGPTTYVPVAGGVLPNANNAKGRVGYGLVMENRGSKS